jgi:hypothetical protein
MLLVEQEQMVLFREDDTDEAPPLEAPLAPKWSYGLGGVLGLALIVAPWVLIGWLVWLLA